MSEVPELLLKPSATFDTPVRPGLDWTRSEDELLSIFQEQPDRFSPMIEPMAARAVSYAPELAAVKRFGERWRADRSFRDSLSSDPKGVAQQYGLGADPEALRPFWDAPYCRALADEWQPSLAVQRYRLYQREQLVYRERLRSVECVPADPRHRDWRNRQIKRTLSHLGPRLSEGIVHAPFALEVSLGCSVGCWFCGVSAERKKADFLYTPANARLWRRVLEVLSRKLGTAAATGFCYWATDPLDNPDYEKLCTDMADIAGRFPQTTTAQPQKSVERTRALLRLSEDRGCTINRFSILTLKQFNQVMEAFSPDELLHCEIVTQNPEASHVQGNTGRARGTIRLARNAEAHGLTEQDGWQHMPWTIACVSGWLINMVEQRVRLITPCPSSPRWPDGYWVLDDRRFRDGEEFEALLEDMMERHMSTTLKSSNTVRFRPDLAISWDERAIRATGCGITTCITGVPHLREIGAQLASGLSTVGDVALEHEDRFGQPATSTMHTLNQIFDSGALDEEPRVEPDAS